MDPIDLYGMHITFFEYGNFFEKIKKLMEFLNHCLSSLVALAFVNNM